MLKSISLGIAIAWCAACKSHWKAETVQPVIQLRAEKTARTSWPLTIVRRDMQLRYARLANTAYYVVVSRDRFRFRLTLRHKWESMSDVRTWDAWVEDAAGVRHPLEDVDQRVVHISFGNVSIYRGIADFSIYGRNLYAVGNRVTLVLQRPGFEYRYVWRSESDPDDEPVPEADLRGRASRVATGFF